MIEKNKNTLSVLDGGIIFLISVTLLLLANITFSFLISDNVFRTSKFYFLVGAAEFVAVGIPPTIYLLAKRISLKSVFKKRITKEQAVLCAFLAIFAYPVLGLLRLVWMLFLGALNIPYLSQPVPPIGGFAIFLVAVAAVSLLPGFFEELIFRGTVQDSFQKKHKITKAILLSSVFFMLMHGDVYSWTYTFAAGIILGIIYYATGSLWAAVIYHTVNNFIGIAVTYIYSLIGLDEFVQGSYDMIPNFGDMFISVIILAVVSVVCFGVCVLLFWGLTKVSEKPKPVIIKDEKKNLIAYVPYIVGGVLMIVITLLPVVVNMIKG